MDLVDDVDLVGANLWGEADLLDQFADVLDLVVGSSVQLVDVEGMPFLEALAGLAFPAGFESFGGLLAVDHLGQDPGAGGLAHSSRSTEEEGLSELFVPDGVLQRGGDGRLADHRIEGVRTVLEG